MIFRSWGGSLHCPMGESMRTLVIGSAGQLGRDLCPLLPGEVIPLTRAEADLTKPELLQAVLEKYRPQIVINCAAFNLVDRAETEPEVAFAVNSWGVRQHAMSCRAIDAVLVQFSSDYVFGLDRSRSRPWGEADLPGPISAYGLSKLTGEYWVRSICPRHYVIRTCGLYGLWGVGGKGGNFVETMLRLASQGKPLRIVNDQRCTPSYTVDVAAASANLISTGSYGLYHVTNSDECSWFEFAGEIFKQAGLTPQLAPITTAEFGAPAARPSYSVLSNEQLQSIGLSPLRTWQQALRAYLESRNRRRTDSSAM